MGLDIMEREDGLEKISWRNYVDIFLFSLGTVLLKNGSDTRAVSRALLSLRVPHHLHCATRLRSFRRRTCALAEVARRSSARSGARMVVAGFWSVDHRLLLADAAHPIRPF